MTKQQFAEITAWQKETFPKADPMSKLHHLNQEIPELMSALGQEDHTIDHAAMRATKMEFADCFFLLFGAASAYGMDYDEISNVIQQKFEINKARKWGRPDENGVVNHIKE